MGEPPKLRSVTLAIDHRCPTCGNFPPEFREDLDRRAQLHWVVPSKSVRYEGPKPEGWDEAVKRFPGLAGEPDQSPSGLYTAVIVPRYLLGRILHIMPEEESTHP